MLYIVGYKGALAQFLYLETPQSTRRSAFWGGFSSNKSLAEVTCDRTVLMKCRSIAITPVFGELPFMPVHEFS